jgi:hypothetical protein
MQRYVRRVKPSHRGEIDAVLSYRHRYRATVGTGWGFHINVINLKSKKK